MLPFLLKPRPNIGGVITEVRPSDNKDSISDDTGLEACAKDLMDAFESKDLKRAASAMRAAFEILESQPHEEIEHKSE